MRLQKLVVVRHGYYGNEGLTKEGRLQVTGLAQVLSDHLKDLTIVLLSSTAPRAEQTSEILAACLGGLSFDKHQCLWSGGNYLGKDQIEETLRLVEEKSDTHDVIILSTHLEFIEDFPSIWGKKQGFSIPSVRSPSKGTARLIDTRTGEVVTLRPPREQEINF